GVAFTPIPNLAFTADFYHIEIDDRITLSENFTGEAIRQQLEAQGIFGVNGGRYFTNAIDTRTNGVDFILRYAYDLGKPGRVKFTAGLNLNDINVTRITPNPPQLASLNNVLFGRREKARIEEGQPDSKLNLMLNYDWKNFALMLRTTRFGEFTTRRNSEAQADRDQTFGAKWITDLDVSYNVSRNLTFGFGGNNIFDIFPDKTIARNSFNGIFPYPSQSPFGFNGSYYYARVAIRR
ncbi:MAG: TonB-dependent receptor, partial [Calditrichaeota bacterium]